MILIKFLCWWDDKPINKQTSICVFVFKKLFIILLIFFYFALIADTSDLGLMVFWCFCWSSVNENLNIISALNLMVCVVYSWKWCMQVSSFISRAYFMILYSYFPARNAQIKKNCSLMKIYDMHEYSFKYKCINLW